MFKLTAPKRIFSLSINTLLVGACLLPSAYAKPGDVLFDTKITAKTLNEPLLINNPELEKQDFYGSSVALLGDIDDNGIPDLLVGANGSDIGASLAGAVHLTLMKADKSLLSSSQINANTENGPELFAGDSYGTSVTRLGDLNGDKIDDIAVGLPGYDIQGYARGAVMVHLLNRDASVKQTTVIHTQTLNGPILADSDNYGISLTGIGDFNADGIPDLAVGAPKDDLSGVNQGTVHIHLLNHDSTIKQTIEINADTPNGPELRPNDYYGSSITSMGDIDGNGTNDIAVGADGDDTEGLDRGAVYLHFMNSDNSILKTVKIDSETGRGPSLENLSKFGRTITAIPDLDGDGVPELVAATDPNVTNLDTAGIINIMFLKANGGIKSTRALTELDLPTLQIPNFNRFGSTIAYLGDIDSDGYPELAVGAIGDNTGGSQTGSVYLLSLDNNHDPVITGSTSAQVTEGNTSILRLFVSDVDDGDVLKMYISGGEDRSFFKLNETGDLTFQNPPDYDSPQDSNRDNVYRVDVSASDDRGGLTTHSIQVQIVDKNEAPSISGLPSTSIIENRPYSFTPRASDPEKSTLTFSAKNLPEWLTLNTENGNIQGTPGRNDVAQFNDITLSVRDSGGKKTDLAPFNITVLNVNEAPTFNHSGNIEVDADFVRSSNGFVEMPAWATEISDTDNNTQSLTFEVLGNTNSDLFKTAPAIDVQTGILSFVPSTSGSSTLTIQLVDDGGVSYGGQDTSESIEISITVLEEATTELEALETEKANEEDQSKKDDSKQDDDNQNGSEQDDSLTPEAEDKETSSGGGAFGGFLLLVVFSLFRVNRPSNN